MNNEDEHVSGEVDEIGVLPEGWAVSTIGECFASIRNGTAESQNREGKGFPVSRIETIQNGRFDFSRVQHIENADRGLIDRFRYIPGDIALSHINSFEHVGKTAIYDGDPETFIHGVNLLRLRLGHEQVVPRFAYWYMQSNGFRDAVRARVHHAVNQVSLNQKSLAIIPFVVPPLAEQKRIVAQVELLLAKVNAARVRLAKVPAILKRFRQSVLAAACSGELTADWRDEHKSAQDGATLLKGILSERSKRAVSEASISKSQTQLSELHALPDSWVWTHLGCITENYDGKRIPVRRDERERRQGKYPYYGASGVIDTIDDYLFDGDFLLIGEDGANLLARSTPIAFQASGKFWVNNHAHVVRPLGNIPLAFLEICVNQLDLQEYVTGSAQPKLTQRNLNRLPIPVPPLVEQHEIVRRAKALFALADIVEQRVQSAAKRADALTQSILCSAFRGELVPTEAELARAEGRDYEPASVLLERIRAQRQAEPGRNGSPRQRKTRQKRQAPESDEAGRLQARANAVEPAPRLEVTPAQAVAAPVPALTALADYSTNELMAEFRAALWGAGQLTETDLLREVARRLGYQRLGKNVHAELKSHLRAAIRRRIVERDGEYVVCPTSIFRNYDTEFLRARLKSVMALGREYTRDDVIHNLAEYLGYRNVTSAMRDHMKSVFNSAIRHGELGHRGQWIWRES